jgi:hypothetical protein
MFRILIIVWLVLFQTVSGQVIPINHNMKNLKIGNTFLYKSDFVNFIRPDQSSITYFINKIVSYDTIGGKVYAVSQNGVRERADSSGVYWIPLSTDPLKPFTKEYLRYPLFFDSTTKRFALLNCGFLTYSSCFPEGNTFFRIDSTTIFLSPDAVWIMGFNVRRFFTDRSQYATIIGPVYEAQEGGRTALRISLCGAFIEGKYYGDSACLVASSTPLRGAEFTTLTASLAPNPVNDIATLRFILPAAQGLTLEIRDMLGREVAPSLVFDALSSGMNALPIDVSSIPRGVYAVRLRTALGLRATTMFVKE